MDETEHHTILVPLLPEVSDYTAEKTQSSDTAVTWRRRAGDGVADRAAHAGGPSGIE